MARRLGLSAAAQLLCRSSSAPCGHTGVAAGLAALQQGVHALQTPPPARLLTGTAAAPAEEEQAAAPSSSSTDAPRSGQHQHRRQQPQQRREWGARQWSPRDGQQQQRQRQQRSSAASHAERPPSARTQRRALFIPRSWEHHGGGDLAAPLVQQLRSLADAADARGMVAAFSEAVRPAAVAGGGAPPLDSVPPPYAWKLYFAALAATGCHAARLSEQLDLMQRLHVPPQAACYVIALRQMAHQGLSTPAYTLLHKMREAGLAPTLRCYQYAIEACLAGAPVPEFGFARRLFGELAAQGLAQHPGQRTELGKLLVRAVRVFSGKHRFGGAIELLDQLEALDGRRVPAFLIAEVMHHATVAEAVDAMLECIQRLERATQTFQEVPGVGEPVTRPLKVEEGTLLAALELAAVKGSVPLAEAAWRLLERSVALPNPPSSGGALSTHLGRAVALEQAQAEDEEEAAAAAAGAAPAPGERPQRLSEELEVGQAAAAEAAHSRRLPPSSDAGGRDRRGPPDARALAEAAAVAAQPRGMRAPSLLAHHARVHAYARAGATEGMFEAVAQLAGAFPGHPSAASYHSGLPFAVDALAVSAEACDAAFYLLEGWAGQGRAVPAESLNLVVAACCQTGDLRRAFETFDSFEALGVAPDADTYNALMQGCLESGRVDTALQVRGQMAAAGVEANAWTHHQLVDAGVVSGDVPAMLGALRDLHAAGHTPRLALLERCLARAERAGDRAAVRELLELLLSRDYRVVGVDAKARRWAPEGGMEMLTGSSAWFSRDEVLRTMRKAHSIGRRIERREQHGGGDGGAAAEAED